MPAVAAAPVLVIVALVTVSVFFSPLVVNSVPANVYTSPYVLLVLFAVTVNGALLIVNVPLV